MPPVGKGGGRLWRYRSPAEIRDFAGGYGVCVHVLQLSMFFFPAALEVTWDPTPFFFFFFFLR